MAPVRVQQATSADAEVVGGLARELAQSFAFSRDEFDVTYPALPADRAALLHQAIGYAESATCFRKLLDHPARCRTRSSTR